MRDLNPRSMEARITALEEGGVTPGGDVAAEDVSYDNTASGLTADDVQAAIDEVEEAVVSIDDALTINNEHFYFDKQNGQYGYNTDEQRGAGTFHPFNAGGAVTITSIIVEATQVTDVTEKSYDREATRGTHIFDREEGLYTYYQSNNLGGEEWVLIDFGEALSFGFMTFTQLVASNVDNVDILVSGSNDGEEFTEITTIDYGADECKGTLSGTYRYLKLSADIEEGKCLTIKKMLIATIE